MLKKEKKYKGPYKKYVIKNSKEYFAQSFADYTLKPKTLKKVRPKTYKYIKNVVNRVSETDVRNMHDSYGWVWGTNRSTIEDDYII